MRVYRTTKNKNARGHSLYGLVDLGQYIGVYKSWDDKGRQQHQSIFGRNYRGLIFDMFGGFKFKKYRL